jgi:ligand-binding SRPBCC domain-containing protein
MKIYTLERIQHLPIGIDEAWTFFSDPRNLPKITPPSMGFRTLGNVPDAMHAGMIVTYRVRPLPRLAVTWVTEITHVEEPHFFVDEQRFGPYRFWHHQHHFREVEGGTEIRDLIHYVLPLDPAGRMVQRWMVGPQLQRIFEYRSRILRERFGTLGATNSAAARAGRPQVSAATVDSR